MQSVSKMAGLWLWMKGKLGFPGPGGGKFLTGFDYKMLKWELERIGRNQIGQSSDELRIKTNRVKKIVDDILRRELTDRFHRFAYAGNADRDLQLEESRDHDIRLFIELQKEDWEEWPCSTSGWKKLYYCGDKEEDKQLLNHDRFLDTNKLGEKYEKLIADIFTQSFGSGSTTHSLQASSRCNGPMIVVTVYPYNGCPSFSFNIILCTNIGSTPYDLVANAPSRTNAAIEWRVSFLQNENVAFDRMNKVKANRIHMLLLRIIKLVIQYNPTLNDISDDMLTNILFHMNNNSKAENYWDSSQLANRFVDMIVLLRDCLEKRKIMVNFDFEKSINLLDEQSNSTCARIAEELTRVINRGAEGYKEILERVSLNASKVANPLPAEEEETFCTIQ